MWFHYFEVTEWCKIWRLPARHKPVQFPYFWVYKSQKGCFMGDLTYCFFLKFNIKLCMWPDTLLFLNARVIQTLSFVFSNAYLFIYLFICMLFLVLLYSGNNCVVEVKHCKIQIMFSHIYWDDLERNKFVEINALGCVLGCNICSRLCTGMMWLQCQVN